MKTLSETLNETLLETLSETLSETLNETLSETLDETLNETLEEILLDISFIFCVCVTYTVVVKTEDKVGVANPNNCLDIEIDSDIKSVDVQLYLGIASVK